MRIARLIVQPVVERLLAAAKELNVMVRRDRLQAVLDQRELERARVLANICSSAGVEGVSVLPIFWNCPEETYVTSTWLPVRVATSLVGRRPIIFNSMVRSGPSILRWITWVCNGATFRNPSLHMGTPTNGPHGRLQRANPTGVILDTLTYWWAATVGVAVTRLAVDRGSALRTACRGFKVVTDDACDLNTEHHQAILTPARNGHRCHAVPLGGTGV